MIHWARFSPAYNKLHLLNFGRPRLGNSSSFVPWKKRTNYLSWTFFIVRRFLSLRFDSLLDLFLSRCSNSFKLVLCSNNLNIIQMCQNMSLLIGDHCLRKDKGKFKFSLCFISLTRFGRNLINAFIPQYPFS